ncbi:citrulline utilization hydrolase CtlX [Modestobacter sp. VKM Ac-2984]|uniref:citrulline utilization hydrolase CtlX n=1 Tax=Modestobacter sp. VKM Ac-2984 TaxID=3004138 RepID=UPI0022AB3F6F|nr:arginine deiminase-related protein [Modestobacter sp. VKM Ac-2984]MCZ2814905.1 arginine deiminase-related protein [Modestobacter sp. VKM Ac-2984]
MPAQAPGAVVLIRPHHFRPNELTRVDNAFQSLPAGPDAAGVAARARDEVTRLAETLEAAGVVVHLFDDHAPDRPDSVFPNNWLSTHPDGRVALYPMFAVNRRSERRADVLQLLEDRYRVTQVVDFSDMERDGLFLESTGAMVLDHRERVAYVSRSHRAHPRALARFCATFGYEALLFDTADAEGRAVYHTNVLMSVGSAVALVGLGMISTPVDRARVVDRLTATGRDVIELSEHQVREFAGNAIELTGRDGPALALSARAAASLTPEQRRRIEATTQLLPVAVPTVELAGGSVRCMIAGVHLTPRAVELVRGPLFGARPGQARVPLGAVTTPIDHL